LVAFWPTMIKDIQASEASLKEFSMWSARRFILLFS
jgi:hypothetical protein